MINVPIKYVCDKDLWRRKTEFIKSIIIIKRPNNLEKILKSKIQSYEMIFKIINGIRS